MAQNEEILNGIDISDCQGVIEWSAVKKAGVQFVVIRSTRGSGKPDNYFKHNIDGARQYDIPFDIYKYTYAKDVAATIAEANRVVDLLRQYEIENITAWWDIEWIDLRKVGKDKLTSNINAARKVIEGAGFGFGVYCNKDWYENVLDINGFDCPVWVARYPSKKPQTFDTFPGHSKKPQTRQELFGWQWASTGQIPGIKGNVDLDVIYLHNSGDIQPACPYVEPAYTLYKGKLAQSKEYVKWLQWYLIQVGTLAAITPDGKNNIDGVFGNRTDLALYKFQLEHPETYTTTDPDRKAGYNTRHALKNVMIN